VAALSRAGILGVTVLAVQGAGAQGGRPERYGGAAHGTASLVDKALLWAVVRRDQVSAVARVIVAAAQTGEQGDGKLFVSPVSDVIRVRKSTGERERSERGPALMLTTAHRHQTNGTVERQIGKLRNQLAARRSELSSKSMEGETRDKRAHSPHSPLLSISQKQKTTGPNRGDGRQRGAHGRRHGRPHPGGRVMRVWERR
jgi:nitrogen regulatory protein PII